MFVKCQSSFCEYMIQMYKKNKKNGKFYGCEKLYFTEFLYERKRKARVRKENFTMAPLRSCFVTVSVFVGISVDVPFVKGSRTGSECVQCPLTPRLPLSKWPLTRLVCFCTVRRPVTQEWMKTLRNSYRSAELLLTATDLHPVCFCVDGEKNKQKGHGAGDDVKATTAFLSLASAPKRPFSIQHPNITGLHHWFYWTASPGMHYWSVNEDYE